MIRLCTICARGGSKGVKNKNLRPLLGKPLLAHTVEQALAAGIFADIVVSSDSPEILQAARDAGVNLAIERPAPLATDKSDKSPAILHCASEAERHTGKRYDTFVDLDVTAPLRRPEHIRGAVELLETTDASNVFSVCPSRRSPYYNMVEIDAEGTARVVKPIDPPALRRQDVPPTYDMNASVYAWKRQAFFAEQAAVFMQRSRLYVMPEGTLFDLDSEFDFHMIEALYPYVCGDSR